MAAMAANAAAASASDYVLRAAIPADVDVIFRVVCDAYAIELGNTGQAFKSANRFLSIADAAEVVPYTDVLCRSSEDGEVVGCVSVQVFDAGSVDDIANPELFAYGRERGWKYGSLGPLAISPALQGTGVGSLLLRLAEEKAKTSGVQVMELSVVNWRSDLRPFYEKRGYEFHHSVEFVSPHVTRKSWFNVMRKVL
jgi:predicted N-acetyltransferase YhbS